MTPTAQNLSNGFDEERRKFLHKFEAFMADDRVPNDAKANEFRDTFSAMFEVYSQSKEIIP